MNSQEICGGDIGRAQGSCRRDERTQEVHPRGDTRPEGQSFARCGDMDDPPRVARKYGPSGHGAVKYQSGEARLCRAMRCHGQTGSIKVKQMR